MQLIFVDGIPGAGKSVLAQLIARRMRQAGQPVRWWYEEELGHPIFVFHDMATLEEVAGHLFSGKHEKVLAAALDKWRSFAAQTTDATVVADGTFFGYMTWCLLYLARPESEAFTYVSSIEEALAPLASSLIYLRQRDVAATLRNVVAVRGNDWAQRTIRKVVDSPYGRARGLEGFDGLARFWSDYQALEDRLFARLAITKLALDVTAGDWAQAEATAAAWLSLPHSMPIETDDFERYVGDYEAADGSHASVTLEGGNLRVRGLHQIWPGQRLVATGRDEFEVVSLPFTIRFSGDAMQVDGPDLLGGRPPLTLRRQPARV
jgi:hypothetical protein